MPVLSFVMLKMIMSTLNSLFVELPIQHPPVGSKTSQAARPQFSKLSPWVLAKKAFRAKTQTTKKIHLESHRGQRS